MARAIMKAPQDCATTPLLGRRATHDRFFPSTGDTPLTRKKAPAKSAKGKKPAQVAKKIAKKPAKQAVKAEAIVACNLEGRSSLCDAAVVASGRSSRHVMAIAEHLARRLKEEGYGTRPVNGAAQGDWALVDAGDVIVHVFRPEVRDYYDLEGMWNVASPGKV